MYTHEEIVKIAKAQKGLLKSLLTAIGCIFLLAPTVAILKEKTSPSIGMVLFGVVTIAIVVTSVMQIIFYFRLASALDKGTMAIVIFLLGFLIPLISFIMLLWLSSKASKALKDEGYKVGLLGGNIEEIEKSTVLKSLDAFT